MTMNRVHLALLIASTVACGGGGDTPDPVQPKDDTPAFEVASGTFDVTATMEFNACEQSTVWDGTYDVQIDSTSFSMGNFTGSWSPNTLRATGETEHESHTTRSCTVTTWTAIYLTFTSENSFGGTVTYRLRLGGDCGDRATCASSWTIHGSRQAPQSTVGLN
jgi:hypothetical protein